MHLVELWWRSPLQQQPVILAGKMAHKVCRSSFFSCCCLEVGVTPLLLLLWLLLLSRPSLGWCREGGSKFRIDHLHKAPDHAQRHPATAATAHQRQLLEASPLAGWDEVIVDAFQQAAWTDQVPPPEGVPLALLEPDV